MHNFGDPDDVLILLGECIIENQRTGDGKTFRALETAERLINDLLNQIGQLRNELITVDAKYYVAHSNATHTCRLIEQLRINGSLKEIPWEIAVRRDGYTVRSTKTLEAYSADTLLEALIKWRNKED